ncbi:MAG TPA: hypothetical protein VGO11_13725 [Chthoniobacteraceae bacterium]|jgi:hypothetical protein|nr:hypothetical protein [Chthoniobacteraceae bacterium]
MIKSLYNFRSPLYAAISWMLLLLPAFAATPFQPGDTAQLTRDEALHFNDKVFRQGRAGQEFTVLAYRPDLKKVFVRATDNTGKVIALTLPEDALALKPIDLPKVRTEAIALAVAGRIDASLQAIDRALRAAPDDQGLATLRPLVTQVRASAEAFAKAQENQRSATVEAARLRKNANTIDRPNPLNQRDQSSSVRAQEMRAEADRHVRAADDLLVKAAAERQSALAALKVLASEQPEEPKLATTVIPGAVPVNPQDPVTTARTDVAVPATTEKSPPLVTSKSQPSMPVPQGQPASPLMPPEPPSAPTQPKAAPPVTDSGAKVGAESAAAKLKSEKLKEWIDDPPAVPLITKSIDWDPSFDATLNFINERIRVRGMKLWFGKNHQKMILDDGGAIFVFDPAVLSTDLKVSSRTYGDTGVTVRNLVVSKRSGSPDFVMVPKWGTFEPGPAAGFQLPCADSVEAEKLGRAVQHLIQMFGGKKDLF